MTENNWEEEFDEKADDFNSGMTLGKYEKKRWKAFINDLLTTRTRQVIGAIPIDLIGVNESFTGLGLRKKLTSQFLPSSPEESEGKPECIRCNDNGCPACDGTKGSPYNPEPY